MAVHEMRWHVLSSPHRHIQCSRLALWFASSSRKSPILCPSYDYASRDYAHQWSWTPSSWSSRSFYVHQVYASQWSGRHHRSREYQGDDPEHHHVPGQQPRQPLRHPPGLRVQPGSSPPGDDGAPGSEQAESERLTFEPTVTASDALNSAGHSSERGQAKQPNQARPSNRRGRRGGAVKQEIAPDVVTLEDLRKSKNETSSSKTTWNTLKGPQPGVKYRGGMVPPAPTWHYDKGDLRAFQKWEKRVRMWMLQVQYYVPVRETGILLFNSLKGELEEELEDAPVEKLFSTEGVEFILETVRKAVETRSVHIKRKVLADYEHIVRGPTETMRTFINRYRRVERTLSTLNINVEQMYDSEARGARLLERSKLSHEHQRQVLVGTMQSLDFDVVKDVLMFQWPDHRPPPQPPGFADKRTQGKGAKGEGKGKSKDQQRQQQQQPRRAYITENDAATEDQDAQQEDTIEMPPDGDAEEQDCQEENEDDHQPEDEAEDDDFTNEIHEIMTVTARKLAGVMQARKFGNTHAGKKSIPERKKTTHCAACGLQGHWAGDAECKSSSSTKPGKGNGLDQMTSLPLAAPQARIRSQSTLWTSATVTQKEMSKTWRWSSTHRTKFLWLQRPSGWRHQGGRLCDLGHGMSKNVRWTALGRLAFQEACVVWTASLSSTLTRDVWVWQGSPCELPTCVLFSSEFWRATLSHVTLVDWSDRSCCLKYISHCCMYQCPSSSSMITLR